MLSSLPAEIHAIRYKKIIRTKV